MQKRTRRVQRVESRLSEIRQQLSGESQTGALAVQETQAATGNEEEKAAGQAEIEPSPVASGQEAAGETQQEPSTGDAFMQEVLLVDDAEHAGPPFAYAGESREQLAGEVGTAAPQETSSRAAQRVRDARAAAEAAEENARLAAQRAAEIAARVEQVGSGRHLIQELSRAQAEAERARAFAREAERAAEEAEREESTAPEPGAGLEDSGEEQLLQSGGQEDEAGGYSKIEIEVYAGSPDEAVAMEETPPSQDAAEIQDGEIAALEVEEEIVDALAARSVAEIAAERAASAEAIAEASSAQTREARRRVQEAEAALGQVRLAIRSGALSGAEADLALRNAEDELTRALAFLADAEANEEQAVNNAMNAEAEAEVAEGMSYAATERELEDLEKLDRASTEVEVAESAPIEVDDEDSTIKIPIIHPPESM